MSLDQIKDSILSFFSAGAIGILIYEIHRMRSSIEEFKEIAVRLMERTDQHEHRLNKIEDKVYD